MGICDLQLTRVDRIDYISLIVSDEYVMEYYPHTAVFVNYHGFSTNSVHCLHAGDVNPSTTEEDLINLIIKKGFTICESF